MKIITVSLFNLHNFGTLVQNYATNKYISSLGGYDTRVLNYCYLYDHKSLGMKRKLSAYRNDFMVKFLLFGRRLKFYIFAKSNIKLTRKYKTFDQIKNNPPEGDMYLVGSDQVWNKNIISNNQVYLLNWIKSTVKMSYSSSIGEDDVDKDEAQRLRNALGDFKYISVRENTGKKKFLIESGLKMLST